MNPALEVAFQIGAFLCRFRASFRADLARHFLDHLREFGFLTLFAEASQRHPFPAIVSEFYVGGRFSDPLDFPLAGRESKALSVACGVHPRHEVANAEQGCCSRRRPAFSLIFHGSYCFWGDSLWRSRSPPESTALGRKGDEQAPLRVAARKPSPPMSPITGLTRVAAGRSVLLHRFTVRRPSPLGSPYPEACLACPLGQSAVPNPLPCRIP